MKIIFLSQDGKIQRLVESLKGDIDLVETSEEVLELLEDIEEEEQCLLFLDYDLDKKNLEKFNKSICGNDWIIRIIISGEMKVKEFRKHQKGKTSAHGYVLKPLTPQVLKTILNDLEVSDLLEEREAYEEGRTLPELPIDVASLSGLDDISEEDLNFDEELDDEEELDEGSFDAKEFQMNTEVRNLVDLHSVKGEAPPFEGELNDKIQAKFDRVFGLEEDNEYFEESEDSFMGGGQNPGSMNLNLREETSESIALDLGSGADGGELDLSGDDEEEIDLSGEDENEEFDLSGEDENEEFDLSGDDEEEIDLSGDDENEEFDLSGNDEEEIDLLGDGEEEIDLSGEDEEYDLSSDDDDFESELDELTQNRELPSPEELSEFDEETGDLEIPGGLNENTGELESVGVLAADNSDDDSPEELDMSDDDILEDEVLEFEDGDGAEDEGELAFSTEPDESVSSSEDEGGLDFNLGGLDDDEGALETGAESSQEQISESGGFDLGLEDGDDDDFSLETGAVSSDASNNSSEETSSVEGMDLSEDDEFDLGEEAILEADLENDEENDEIEDEVVQASEDSEFDDEELDFDEDEEVEKTQAVNLSDITGGEDNGLEASDDLDDDIEALSVDGDDDIGEEDLEEDLLEAGGHDDSEFGDDEVMGSEFDSDEDLLNDDFEENTNPTVVMTQDVTRDLEQMVDDGPSLTNEFRPGKPTQEASLSEEDLLDDDLLEEDEEEYDLTEEQELPEELADETVIEEEALFDEEIEEEIPQEEPMSRPPPKEEGTLNITREEDRHPPVFNEGEAVRLQATIRQLREEREQLLSDIQGLKKDAKLLEQDNLGLKAELDEAKIEISILKKRHGNEMDEMKYRLRISDEKKLYAEEKAKKLQKEFDRLQGKVRVDFNQIKQREKALESQLELVKMDSESQVQSRDKKILELKRKIDQLEFNMENIVIREQKSRDDKVRLEERLERIMKTLRGSIEVLEGDIEFDPNNRRGRD